MNFEIFIAKLGAKFGLIVSIKISASKLQRDKCLNSLPYTVCHDFFLASKRTGAVLFKYMLVNMQTRQTTGKPTACI